MKIKIFNTLTRKKENFVPLKKGQVSMYTCGMTVYDHTHIGHMRTYVNTDFLRRMLEYNGLRVKQVENITDVGHLTSDADTGEDKLQKKARLERKTAWEVAKIYTQEFFATMEALNVLKPQVVAPATKHIKEMVAFVKKLEENGFTYIIPGDGVYFDTNKLPDYGKLARLNLKGLKAGARISMVSGKKKPTDFALWKFAKKNEARDMVWPSPWAKKSFPGWHIECSAIGAKYLGKRFDIHTGGEDHIPVHHTNERAQNMAAFGHAVVKLWFHNVFLMVEGKKMGKSLGNFYWLKDIKARGFEPLALRYLFLTAHYHSRLNFTWKGLKAAKAAYNKLMNLARQWQQQNNRPSNQGEIFKKKFLAKINDDLNMPGALAVVWEMSKSKLPAADKLALLLDFDQVLGLQLAKAAKRKVAVPEQVKKLAAQRAKLRKADKWQEADEIRLQIKKLGWTVKDTRQGQKLHQS